jgi:hypothetical protein
VPDHQQVWQINLLIDPLGAFIQQESEVYWLEISFGPQEANIGWKQSGSTQFRDDAVYRVDPGFDWLPIEDDSGARMDMAFVITPEPATLSLLALGGLALLRRRR